MPEDYQNQIENKEDLNQREIERSSPQPPSLNNGQKIAVAVLAVFAILVIGIWLAQFKKSISEPLASRKNITTAVPSAENSEDLLRLKDSDSDGLSDWDELYLYKTSPYIEDSDSDGFSDKEEINNEKDPNCPAGRDCYGNGVASESTLLNPSQPTSQESEILNNLLDQLNQENVINEKSLTNESSAGQEAVLQEMLEGQSDTAKLRQILLDYGMDQELLNQISDEELLKVYQEILVEQP